MLLFGIIVYGVYAYITLNNAMQLQKNETKEKYYELTKKIDDIYDRVYDDMYRNSDPWSYTLQNFSDEDTKIIYYRDIIPESPKKKSSTYETHNSIPFTFHDGSLQNTNFLCTIDYENLRKSIFDEDYEEICEYINKESDADNNNARYILSCAEGYIDYYDFEYYESLGIFYPSKLQVLKIDDDRNWYIQAEVVKEYILSTDDIDTENSKLCKIGDMYFNEIDKDFFEGNYYKSNITDDEIDDVYKNGGEGDFYYLGDFNYIYQNSLVEQYLIKEYKIPENEKDTPYVTINKQDSFWIYHKFNLLESCKNELITMLIYIIITFTGMGVLIAFMSWHTLKKQIKLEEKRRELTNSMSHDLKTPIFVIGSYAENLIENVHTDKKEHYAQMIYDKTLEMNELVQNMLELSKLENNNIYPNKEEFDLVELIKEILVQFKAAKDFSISLDGSDQAIIKADKNLIKRAITNLIQNAEKYSEENKAIITVSQNEFKIANACTKIKSNEIKKLWEPYYMGNNSVRNNGNGLGLSIVKNIMQAHKFDFGARLENKNIIFYFVFKK
ncbi:MAG: HAMP domain-containing histidine kinase [Ruminococcus sp.]|nr:HAMP domain-containing histidine kinase [Ruminococcus sp.]